MVNTGSTPRHGLHLSCGNDDRREENPWLIQAAPLVMASIYQVATVREGNGNPCYKQTAPHVMAALYQAAKVREGNGNPCSKQAAPHVMAALYQAAKVSEGKGMGIHAINRQHPSSWQPFQAAKMRKGKRMGMGIHVTNRQRPTPWPPFIRWQR